MVVDPNNQLVLDGSRPEEHAEAQPIIVSASSSTIESEKKALDTQIVFFIKNSTTTGTLTIDAGELLHLSQAEGIAVVKTRDVVSLVPTTLVHSTYEEALQAMMVSRDLLKNAISSKSPVRNPVQNPPMIRQTLSHSDTVLSEGLSYV